MNELHENNRIENEDGFLCDILDFTFIEEIEKIPLLELGRSTPYGYCVTKKFQICVERRIKESDGQLFCFIEGIAYSVDSIEFVTEVELKLVYDTVVSHTVEN